jgi:hypothetical protein
MAQAPCAATPANLSAIVIEMTRFPSIVAVGAVRFESSRPTMRPKSGHSQIKNQCLITDFDRCG